MDRIRHDKNLNIPNILTGIRIVLLPAIVWRFRRGDSIGALAVYLISMLTDAVDGIVARKFNQITALGKLLDPIADKLTLITLLGMFAADGQIPMWLLYAVLIKEIILIIGGAAALKRGIVVYALPIGKVTTVTFILSMAARFLSCSRIADLLLGVSLVLSFAALLWYTVVLMRKMRLCHAE